MNLWGFVMNASDLFEIFNHCASQKDPAQVLALADNIEVFCSDSISDGKVYYGEDAPEAFRSAFKALCDNAGVFTLRVKHKTGGANSSVFVTDLRNGGALSTSVLQFGIEKKKWTTFIQTSS